MASSAYVRWLCGGWCLLLCAVSLTVNAATRVPVKVNTSAVANGAGAATKVGDNVRIPGTPGTEYIPRTPSGTPGTPIKVIPTIDYSIPRTITQVKSYLKANAAQAMMSAAIAAAVAGVGWVMNPENTELKKKQAALPDGTPLASTGNLWNPASYCVTYPASQTLGKVVTTTWNGKVYAVGAWKKGEMPSGYTANNNCTSSSLGYFPTAAYYPSSGQKIISEADIQITNVPLTDADWNSLDSQINGSTADFIKNLIKDSCNGSTNPGGCFDSLMSQSALSGPATVSGGTSTSTSTYTKPDGTTGTRSTDTTTNFNITYGPDYFDFSKTVTQNTYEDGVKTGTTTETEGSEVTQEQPSDDEEEKPVASPCAGTKCDGPKYEDLYKPKDDTANDVNNDYITRVKNIPILTAVGGFFNVGGGGSCPTWQTTVNIDIGIYRGSYSLDFYFFCTPTALQTYQWASYVLMLLAAWVGFKWGILD